VEGFVREKKKKNGKSWGGGASEGVLRQRKLVHERENDMEAGVENDERGGAYTFRKKINRVGGERGSKSRVKWGKSTMSGGGGELLTRRKACEKKKKKKKASARTEKTLNKLIKKLAITLGGKQKGYTYRNLKRAKNREKVLKKPKKCGWELS